MSDPETPTAAGPSPGNDAPVDPAALPVLLEAGSAFDGLLALAGPARVDGHLRGRVVGGQAGGALWIGPAGEVEADLELETVIVEGRVRGDISARARIELLASAHVEGDCSAPILRVADGCHWNGRSRAGTRG